ncbi:tetratricopeptide repeat protein [Clostridium sp. Sa3CUN1]|uniref:Tetratricopeptide repeat protein n=1 Tax=Clostridium gallinarum TaxID=2762246 RepID=A0ABR8PZY0_9CLOT|nr:tetratricopeptide repeat protein [Clostridium gallinarum]MBD7913728.1 tetratricopeptide repeat protein [Clostridium gallinarum]
MNFFNDGNKYYNIKEYEKAIEFYKKAIDNNENTACSYYNSGVCYIKIKNFDKAIEMIKAALSIQQESKYYFNLAYCYAMKENVRKALIYFNISWSLDSTDSDCEKAINLLIAKNKKWDISN